jgi:hypothetical protein
MIRWKGISPKAGSLAGTPRAPSSTPAIRTQMKKGVALNCIGSPDREAMLAERLNIEQAARSYECQTP